MFETEVPLQINPDVLEAYQVLNARALPRELAMRLAKLTADDIPDLISLANKVRGKFTADFHACTIMNAKSGACAEDCKFCAQSSHHTAEIETYALTSQDKILADAKQAFENDAKSFGIVTSGTGFHKIDAEFQKIIDAIQAIHEKYPTLNVCASLGTLTAETAAALAKVGIAHYNINLQVVPQRYAELVSTTQSIETRMETIRLLAEHNIKTCVGGIIGLGESMEDRIAMGYALKELDVDVIPLNVLIPIPGTALENQPLVPAADIAKTFAIFRLIHPMKTIKFAAGRETRMKDFQGLLMLAGANGLLTGGYLTTRGRETKEDEALIKELKYF
ncbi:biotin synthase BioB [bacterium]|nr:biotin synthase BioB [bacterium]